MEVRDVKGQPKPTSVCVLLMVVYWRYMTLVLHTPVAPWLPTVLPVGVLGLNLSAFLVFLCQVLAVMDDR